MRLAIDVALISTMALLVLAKVLSVPVEIGIPFALAGGIANGWRLLSRKPEGSKVPSKSSSDIQ
jgi:hypothetical protein